MSNLFSFNLHFNNKEQCEQVTMHLFQAANNRKLIFFISLQNCLLSVIQFSGDLFVLLIESVQKNEINYTPCFVFTFLKI